MEDLYTFNIPDNFIQVNRIFGFRIRNIIEAVAAFALVCLLISPIPFVPKISFLCMGVLGSVAALRVLLGERGRSITEFLIDWIIYKKRARKIHLRTVQHDTAKAYQLDSNGERMSYAEQMVNKLKAVANGKTNGN